jgi:hypothetical protein
VKLNLKGLNFKGKVDGRGWPNYLLGGRVRTSTAALVVAFIALFWVGQTFQPKPVSTEAPPTQVVPPGFVPDPNYTWVPRTKVRPRETPTTTPTTTTPTTTSPTETTSGTTSPTSPTESTPATPTTTVVDPDGPGPLPPQTITPTLTPSAPPAPAPGPVPTTPVPPR